MSEQNYRRNLVAHNEAVQVALAGTTDAVREYLKRFRLDLYPLDWLHGEIAALERLSAAATLSVSPPPKGIKNIVAEMLIIYGVKFTDVNSRDVAVNSWAWQFALELSSASLSEPRPALEAETEQRLREYLWLSHGHQGVYGDDGEMQCGQCAPMWDYKRSPLKDVIEQALKARTAVNLAILAATPVSSAPPPAPMTEAEKRIGELVRAHMQSAPPFAPCVVYDEALNQTSVLLEDCSFYEGKTDARGIVILRHNYSDQRIVGMIVPGELASSAASELLAIRTRLQCLDGAKTLDAIQNLLDTADGLNTRVNALTKALDQAHAETRELRKALHSQPGQTT